MILDVIRKPGIRNRSETAGKGFYGASKKKKQSNILLLFPLIANLPRSVPFPLRLEERKTKILTALVHKQWMALF